MILRSEEEWLDRARLQEVQMQCSWRGHTPSSRTAPPQVPWGNVHSEEAAHYVGPPNRKCVNVTEMHHSQRARPTPVITSAASLSAIENSSMG